jgi:hypothetical protein
VRNLNDNFSLYEHQDGSFAWHLKVKRTNVEVSHNLLALSEEAQIQGDDLISAIFLALYKREQLPGNYHKDIETFILAKEPQLNPGEVKYKLLLDQEGDGQPAWLLAAKSDNLKLLKELWTLAKEK